MVKYSVGIEDGVRNIVTGIGISIVVFRGLGDVFQCEVGLEEEPVWWMKKEW